MPGRAILIAGLPGSGKSTYARELRRSENATEYVHDYHWKSHFDKAELRSGRKFRSLIDGLRRGETWISCDVQWCKPEMRERVEQELKCEVPGLCVEWHFIRCDLEVCRDRIRQRGREGLRNVEKELKLLDGLAPEYSIPSGGRVIVTDQSGVSPH